MRELRVVRADPAGNITLFVLTPVEKAECAAVAAKLLAIEALKAEQVGFIFPNGHMEMEAGEFCGNASRAYGYLLAKQQGLKGRHTMRLSVSGCDHPVAVTVDMDAGTASAEMPLPKLVEQVEVAGTAGTLVHLGGIAHLVVQGVAPSRDFFAAAEPIFAEDPMLEAYGVCFIEGERMTPLVKVPEAGTLVFEGSCGSGNGVCVCYKTGRRRHRGIHRRLGSAGSAHHSRDLKKRILRGAFFCCTIGAKEV